MSLVDPEARLFGELAQKVWYWPVIRGALSIILGIIAFAAPVATVVTFAVLIGIWFLVDGIIAIVDAVRHRGSSGMAFHIIVGVVGLAFGLLLLLWPGKTLGVLIYLAGIWAIVLGVLEIIASIVSRKSNSGWIWGVVVGAVAVVFGILVAAMPGITLVTLTWIVAIFAIVFGIFWIVFGFMIRSAGKKAVAGQ